MLVQVMAHQRCPGNAKPVIPERPASIREGVLRDVDDPDDPGPSGWNQRRSQISSYGALRLSACNALQGDKSRPAAASYRCACQSGGAPGLHLVMVHRSHRLSRARGLLTVAAKTRLACNTLSCAQLRAAGW
jgi:hypothetical protein